jgi:DNA-binding transcriptional regulator YhcF (GntR family)
LAVNQNTILRVYERLVREDLLEMRQGQGTFVAAHARSSSLAAHHKRLLEEMRQWARQGTSLGLDADGLHELLNEAIQQMHAIALHKPEVSR